MPKFCSKCGTEISEKVTFCSSCGADIAKFWYNKGVDFSNSNEYEKALESYNYALSFEDKDPDIWINKCNILIKLGDYEEAIKSGNKAADLDSADPLIWDNLLDAYNASGNQEKATECSERLAKIKSKFVEKKTYPAYIPPVKNIVPTKPSLYFSDVHILWQNLQFPTFFERISFINIIMIMGWRTWDVPIIVGETLCNTCGRSENHTISRQCTSGHVNIIPCSLKYGNWSATCSGCKNKATLSKTEIAEILKNSNLMQYSELILKD